MPNTLRILYCHCNYAQVVPPEVKAQVLAKLAESNIGFDAVADLCEMSAKRDPALKQLASGGPVRIAACYPRAVRGLFVAADAPLPAEGVEICNMRTETAEQVIDALLREGEAPAEPDSPRVGLAHPSDAVGQAHPTNPARPEPRHPEAEVKS